MRNVQITVDLAMIVLVSVVVSPPASGQLVPSSPLERLGSYVVAKGDFPAPAGTVAIPITGGDFEASDKPPSWPAGGEVVTSADAPQGKRYTRIPDYKGGILMTPAVKIVPGRPHFLTFWIRSPVAEWAAINFHADLRLVTFGDHYPGVPATGARWRHLGYYVLAPADARTISLQIQPMKAGPKGEFIDVDEIRLRTATFAEMSAAYAAERAELLPYDDSPRPGDGGNLALSVAKWQGQGIPGKPFVIWAIGSSWTNFLGDGYPLLRAIRERFPHAPELVYRKHAGSGTPWEYVRGWVDQFVGADDPDLILTYTNGSPEGLDALLTSIRRRTTADVIVPSLHFFENSSVSDDDVEHGVVDWDQVRAICRKHHAEFVENRRELAGYLHQINVRPPALLFDAVHQNRHGVIRIWDNIVRHIPRPDGSAGLPDGRERRIAAALALTDGKDRDKVTVSAGWTRQGDRLRTHQKGASISVQFTGSRIDLLGVAVPDGGAARVRIDGQDPGAVPAFATDYILPHPVPGPLVLKGPGPGDVAPHAVGLGTGIIPQSWTIVMTSDAGDYRLEGTVTGLDGTGNSTRSFLSRSGQIAIDPALWRHNRDVLPGGKVVYGNRAGDRFGFDVVRTAGSEVRFHADSRREFFVPLVRNLPNGLHTLEIVASGDGEAIVDGFYIAEPPIHP